MKRFRSATGDTLSLEFRADSTDDDGTRNAMAGAEIWTLHRGKIVEWHCSAHGR